MKNIHVLPTDKPSRLFIYDGKLSLSKEFHYGIYAVENQNIYITSDEEIKEGDWFLDNNNNSIGQSYKLSHVQFANPKKIILTTDFDKQPRVQAIDDKFLEWFVKNPSCEEVEVVKEDWEDKTHSYETIIPKEEQKQETLEDFGLPQFGTKEFNDLASQFFGGKPKQKTQGYICPQTKVQCNDEFCVSAEKCNLLPSTDVFSEPEQETLEEAAEIYHLKHKHPQNQYSKEAFINGAKWQQERSYSEEEVNEMFDTLKSNSIDNVVTITNVDLFISSWKKQFKKK